MAHTLKATAFYKSQRYVGPTIAVGETVATMSLNNTMLKIASLDDSVLNNNVDTPLSVDENVDDLGSDNNENN